MALPSPIIPGTDDFQVWVNSFNALLSVTPDGATWDGSLLSLNNGVTSQFSVALPPPPDRKIGGFSLSISGAYAVDWTAGSVVLGAQIVSGLLGSSAIVAADPNNPRIDALAIASNGTVTLTTGTPAEKPVAPAVSGFILGYVYVPVTGAPTVVDSGCCPAGNYEGQKLMWTGAQWVPAFNFGLKKFSTKPETILPEYDRVIFLPGADLGTFTLDAGSLSDGWQPNLPNN